MPRGRSSSSDRGWRWQQRQRRAQMPLPNGQPCPYCARPMWPADRLDVDHVIPRSLGGTNGPVRWAHASCNRSYGNGTRRGQPHPPSRRW